MILPPTSPIFVELIDPWLQLKNGNRIFTSLEGENPGGSMKDHMVRGELEDLLKNKLIPENGSVAEVSSGSTAASLAYYCPRYGLKCILFVPSGIPGATVSALQKQGAEIHIDEMKSIYATYDHFTAEHRNLRRFEQLFDGSKRRHYHSLGQDVLSSLGPVDAIVGSVGTGHSLLGTAEGLGRPLIISAEPEPSLHISGVRNVASERYGDKDACQPQEFDQRIIVKEESLSAPSHLLTTEGGVQTSPSFQLVMVAVREFLKDKKGLTIFAVGASLRRLDRAYGRKVA